MTAWVSIYQDGLRYMLGPRGRETEHQKCTLVHPSLARSIIKFFLASEPDGLRQVAHLLHRLDLAGASSRDPHELLRRLEGELDALPLGRLVLLEEPRYEPPIETRSEDAPDVASEPAPEAEPPPPPETPPPPPPSAKARGTIEEETPTEVMTKLPKLTDASAPIDQEAQAAVLERAAEQGIPLCEECEKARPRAAT